MDELGRGSEAFGFERAASECDAASGQVGPLRSRESSWSGPDLAEISDEYERARVFDALFQRSSGPRRLGRYVVVDTLGQGGMGVVLRAFDRELDRPVALKVLHRAIDQQHATRLRREAQAMAKLSHPNVVQVYEVGEVEGRSFVAMELVKGLTPRQWVAQEPRPDWRACVSMFIQLGSGLAAAHERGLVHRDFKPSNAIIDSKGRPRVLDFGLARQTDDDDPSSVVLRGRTASYEPVPLDVSLTRTGAVLGTPAYMPLEQMNGFDADARSDQFSFCVSLYEAVYGERPYEGDSIQALMMSLRRGVVRPPPPGSPVPRRLRAVLLRGLAVGPEQRWPSMDVLLDVLRRTTSSNERDEVARLRHHMDLGIGVRARVAISFVVGLLQLLGGVTAHLVGAWTGRSLGYGVMIPLCVVSSVLVVGFILRATRGRVFGSRRRPMSLISRTQMSLVVAMSIAVPAMLGLGLGLGVPIAAVVVFVLLAVGLIVGAMAAFMPRMLVSAVVFIACVVGAAVWPDSLWLWWGTAGGIGLLFMAWAWRGSSRSV